MPRLRNQSNNHWVNIRRKSERKCLENETNIKETNKKRRASRCWRWRWWSTKLESSKRKRQNTNSMWKKTRRAHATLQRVYCFTFSMQFSFAVSSRSAVAVPYYFATVRWSALQRYRWVFQVLYILNLTTRGTYLVETLFSVGFRSHTLCSVQLLAMAIMLLLCKV